MVYEVGFKPSALREVRKLVISEMCIDSDRLTNRPTSQITQHLKSLLQLSRGDNADGIVAM